ncbi:MAG: hypothetical protein ABIR54_05335 [Burkholderiaceae bacterium]|jgi:hypothetical protein
MAPNTPSVTFFGYWSGQLPAVSQLHFRSFLAHHPESIYDLWLDQDTGSAISAPELQWLKSHPRIRVRPFSLNALIEQQINPRPRASRQGFSEWLRKIGYAVHRKIGPSWSRRKAWDHAQFGLTYMHSSLLFPGFERDLTYRGDIARFLVPLCHYPLASLYCDLDICFMSDLTRLCESNGFVYRWETFGFANNAIVYMPNTSWSAALARKANAIETFRPWILLSDAHCAELGLTIHPARLFDPLWDPTSLLYGDTAKFFGPRDNLALDLHALNTERHLAIHWHNNWKTVPAPNSIYSGLLKACEGANA